MDWKVLLDQRINLVNNELEKYMGFKTGKNETIVKAMHYSLMAGGKRLRPILAIAAYDIFNKNIEEVLPYACGIEMIHTYSLIHDDLPAMDDDDFRRGKPTNHKVFGEGVAVLAGDALLNYAFEIMLQDAIKKDNMKPYIESIKVIADAAGINGMIGGQIVDLESENKIIDEDTLNYIHLNKTAALITAPLKVGAIISNACEEDIQNMEFVGKNLGLAFQIRDDILDIVGEKNKLGKNIGSDESKHKSTYPSLYGLEYSINKVKELTFNVHKVLKQYDNSTFLYELSNYLINREY